MSYEARDAILLRGKYPRNYLQRLNPPVNLFSAILLVYSLQRLNLNP
jgi:hypothetical protein